MRHVFKSYYLDCPLVKGRIFDVFEPEEITKDVAVFWIHGGGWRGGGRDFHEIMQELSDRGYIVASTDYRLYAKDAFEQLKDVLSSDCYCWIEDENKRKQNYRDLITNAGCSQLLSAIRVLERDKKEQFEAGKKFHQCDENFLRDAERLVFEELSVVLELDVSKVSEYLHSLLQNV